ncbi:L,D-transpeptidase family protein [Novosphingobium sp. 1949]|uniref:L,D-transpeptidase family protein n=1 Tax=Novosphingobium organovorum TaxID=2930092 RepID=A0ABT0BD37_9SPHN|nr:L,D-transpeptidase family protein [Novosphingobium organovorum]MCJ2182968.1 L,D-transpeptidase family protein [Novosphingobium organovorum]
MLRLAPLFLLVAAAGPARPSAPLTLPEVDMIRVFKGARTMELWQGARRVHVITGIQLGGQPLGPKRFEGDQRTPEGRYTIDWANPNSRYHLSLHISYPDAADRAYAQRRGRSAGGMIMIHGQPNAWPVGRVPGDWTDGCIAVSDEEVEALWQAVPDGTLIILLP